jgi:hypothetical protein
MADIVKYKTVNTTEGAHTIQSGLNLSQILKVARRGVQQDNYPFLTIGDPASTRGWAFIAFNRRIVFLDDIPFEAGEKIYIMYKIVI